MTESKQEKVRWPEKEFRDKFLMSIIAENMMDPEDVKYVPLAIREKVVSGAKWGFERGVKAVRSDVKSIAQEVIILLRGYEEKELDVYPPEFFEWLSVKRPDTFKAYELEPICLFSEFRDFIVEKLEAFK